MRSTPLKNYTVATGTMSDIVQELKKTFEISATHHPSHLMPRINTLDVQHRTRTCRVFRTPLAVLNDPVAPSQSIALSQLEI
jgi:hypothetical protein